MKFKNRFLFFALLIGILNACQSNPLLVDTKNIAINIDFIYVDEQLTAAKSLQEFHQLHQKFITEFGDIYRYEVKMNLQINDVEQAVEQLKTFYESPYVQSLEAEKKVILPKVKESQPSLITSFKYFHYHFPDAPLPSKVLFMNKMFSGIKCSDSIISVGIENYLGPENPVIQSIPSDQLYLWQKERMDLNFLHRDIAQAWIQAHLFTEIDDYLIQHIIQAGKVLYLLKAMFPNEKDAFIMRYSAADWDWAVANEQSFWEYLVKEEWLFKNAIREKNNLLNEGPYTVGLPEKGPDRMGQFLGYKMVKHFMSKNKNIPLQELLGLDFNVILQAYEID